MPAAHYSFWEEGGVTLSIHPTCYFTYVGL